MVPAQCDAVAKAWNGNPTARAHPQRKCVAEAGHARSWRNYRPPICLGLGQRGSEHRRTGSVWLQRNTAAAIGKASRPGWDRMSAEISPGSLARDCSPARSSTTQLGWRGALRDEGCILPFAPCHGLPWPSIACHGCGSWVVILDPLSFQPPCPREAGESVYLKLVHSVHVL